MFQRERNPKECADKLSKPGKSEFLKVRRRPIRRGTRREDDGGHGRRCPEAEAQCSRHLLQEARPGMTKCKYYELQVNSCTASDYLSLYIL